RRRRGAKDVDALGVRRRLDRVYAVFVDSVRGWGGHNECGEYCVNAIKTAPNAEGVDVLGPAPAPISILRGRHRRRFLIQAPKSVDLSAYMAAWRARLKTPGGVRISIDIDPYTFL
ncbi:MAG: hypothetical protein AAFQ67_07695, partial [Pseudomonadota bacterium]